MNGRPDPITLARIEEGLRRAGPDASWEDVRRRIVPVLARVHQPIAPGVRLVRVSLPPGLWVGFGVDLGPVFTHVSTAELERWGVDEARLVETALANLSRLARKPEVEVSSIVFEGHPVVAVQASGWGSSMLLVPTILAEVLGPEPRLVFAPVRNTILAVLPDAPAELVIELWDGLALDDPTELDGDVYRLEGGVLEPMGVRRNPGGGLIVGAGSGPQALPN